jgi:hypothetical protein
MKHEDGRDISSEAWIQHLQGYMALQLEHSSLPDVTV